MMAATAGPAGERVAVAAAVAVLVVANYAMAAEAEFGGMETGKVVTHDQDRGQQPHSQECRCTLR